MTPRHGEIWLVDMGMAAKTRPTVVLIADNVNAPRYMRKPWRSAPGWNSMPFSKYLLLIDLRFV